MAKKIRVFALAKQLGLRSQALLAALQEIGVANVSPATAIDEETAKKAHALLEEQAKTAREAAEKAAAAAAPAEETAPEKAKAEPAAKSTAAPAKSAARRPSKPAPATPAAAPAAAAPAAPASAESKTGRGAKDRRGEEPDAAAKEEKEAEKFLQRHSRRRDEVEDGLAELERQLAEIEAKEEEERARRAKAGEVVPLPELVRRPTGERPESAVDVPPVVTVLGHVDHGKTTLLDSLRETDVAGGESGGITQHIGASEIVTKDGSRIVFIDTPGHEAFTAMRARGAMVTDIAILIVAANDGIMPQTVEAINHVKAAGVPIIVAINKVDLPDANPDRVKQQLLEHELVPEEWGGDIVCVPISALSKQGLDELLEMIMLVAEMQQLWAEPDAEFAGIVVESEIDTSQGTMCTVLVRNGTLKVGDSVVCGSAFGRIRRLRTWTGKSVKEMGPGSPVEVVGLTGMPESGEIMTRVKNPKEARRIGEERADAERVQEMSGSEGLLLRDLFKGAGAEEKAALKVLLKADVWGSVQALESKLLALDARLDELDITIISTGVGEVSESDIMLAKASEGIIIAFHCEVAADTQRAADAEGVEIRQYDVIYEALEDVERALLGLLAPVYEEVLRGKAEVLQLFRISRIGVIAGCRATEGRLIRKAEMRVIRGKEEVFRGELESLKHFDQDVRVVEAPSECGISIKQWRGWEEGDIVEVWEKVRVERKLPLKEPEEAS